MVPYMSDLEKTTVYLDAEVYRQLKRLARERGQSAAELVREAVVEYAKRYAAPSIPASIGAGRSGRSDLSEQAESLLEGMGQE